MHPWPWHGALKTKAAISRRVLDLLASGTEALAPAIWPLELVDALLMAERRKRITVAQVAALLRRIAGLPISVDPTPPRPRLRPDPFRGTPAEPDRVRCRVYRTGLASGIAPRHPR